MKAKVSCIIFLMSFMIVTAIGPAKGQSESKDQLLKFYESCIQKKISNCKAKTVLKTSSSENLQRKANLSMKQVNFLTSNKDTLINEMIEQGIAQKCYAVEYFLNKRFFEMNQ